MSGLMAMSPFVANEPPPPSIAPLQNDSPSVLPISGMQNDLLSVVPISHMQNDRLQAQVTEQCSERSGQFGVFLGILEGKSRKNPETPSEQFCGFFARQELFVSEIVTALDSRFIIATNRQEILRFVEANDLVHVLLQSEKHLKTAFGESSLKTLAIVEDDEGYRTLFCIVIFPGTLQE